MILIVVFYVLSHLIGFAIWDTYNTQYPFLLPKSIYNICKVNWFGAMFIYLVYFVSTPLYAIDTFTWWLCTVGRK